MSRQNISAYSVLGAGATSNSTFTTTSYTPLPNQLVLVMVASTISSGTPAAPTLSGNSLTYVQVATIQNSTDRRLTVFRALGSSPSAGAITISFSGVTQTWCAWEIINVGGADKTGTNGSGAIIQAVTNTGAATPATVTLSSFANSTNRPIAFCLREGNATITVKSGYFSLGPDIGNNTVPVHINSGWLYSATDTNPTFSFTTAAWSIIGLEIGTEDISTGGGGAAHAYA